MNKTPHMIWGSVVAIAVSSIAAGICFVSNANLQFDKTCVQNNKSVVWSTKEGANSPVKECK